MEAETGVMLPQALEAHGRAAAGKEGPYPAGPRTVSQSFLSLYATQCRALHASRPRNPRTRFCPLTLTLRAPP